jgi:hypothetical protein
VSEAHKYSAALIEMGLCVLYSDSVETGDINGNFHNQCCRVLCCRGGPETAKLIIKSFYTLCSSKNFPHMVVTVQSRVLEFPESTGTDGLGYQLM